MTQNDLGNAAYRIKEFVTAHAHYDKAIELDPTSISFYNNKAAVYYDEEKIDECVAACKEAVRIGRETQADYKLIAKAMSRAGNAFQKKGDVEKALFWFQRSISIYMDLEIMDLMEPLLAKRNGLYKLDPVESEKCLYEGNIYSDKNEHETAIEFYAKAIKFNINSVEAYCRRAKSFGEIREYQSGLNDCEVVEKLKPELANIHVTKAKILLKIGEFERGRQAASHALKLSPGDNSAENLLSEATRQMTSRRQDIPSFSSALVPVVQNAYQIVNFDTWLLMNDLQTCCTITGIPANYRRWDCEEFIRSIAEDTARVLYSGVISAGRFGIIVAFRTKKSAKSAAKKIYDLGYFIEFTEKEEPKTVSKYLCDCGDIVTGKQPFLSG
uniref:TPR_REGION domain-containing protein n=1 Tax=Caenorhabditis tropicalis TaxID=1561998 RepID=A0A1I7UEK7_9PELO